ncbi:hypothetical protein C4D60_Mb06t21540 [Musa balbisiana]|uniref:Uncharacterized protein n=1 Tax=Musa balbisiana TaxID=52838 RepID=A0A4S8IPV2_MUSBA|nr:hypothetical protein C4D60_Mb06t21540 [Musa balbisiana]
MERRFVCTVGQVCDRGGILFVIPRIPLIPRKICLGRTANGAGLVNNVTSRAKCYPNDYLSLLSLDVRFRGIVCGSHILSLWVKDRAKWISPFRPRFPDRRWHHLGAQSPRKAEQWNRPCQAVAPPRLGLRVRLGGGTTPIRQWYRLSSVSELCQISKEACIEIYGTSPIPWAVNSEIYPEASRGIYGGMFRLHKLFR